MFDTDGPLCTDCFSEQVEDKLGTHQGERISDGRPDVPTTNICTLTREKMKALPAENNTSKAKREGKIVHIR